MAAVISPMSAIIPPHTRLRTVLVHRRFDSAFEVFSRGRYMSLIAHAIPKRLKAPEGRYVSLVRDADEVTSSADIASSSLRSWSI